MLNITELKLVWSVWKTSLFTWYFLIKNIGGCLVDQPFIDIDTATGSHCRIGISALDMNYTSCESVIL